MLTCPYTALFPERSEDFDVLLLRAEEPQQRLGQRVPLHREQRRHALQLAVVDPLRAGRGRQRRGLRRVSPSTHTDRHTDRQARRSSYILVPAGQERHHRGPALRKAAQQSGHQNLHRIAAEVTRSQSDIRNTWRSIHTYISIEHMQDAIGIQ